MTDYKYFTPVFFDSPIPYEMQNFCFYPDWKVCRMHGGSLLRQLLARLYFCCKTIVLLFLLLFYKNFAAGTVAEI